MAAGFCLDTMATHRLHKTPMVKGQHTLITYTDYVNHYPSILQTSYSLWYTNNSRGLCWYGKSQWSISQESCSTYSRYACLEQHPDIQPLCIDMRTESRKLIECVRIDGASDEGLSHEEVQFFWTLCHVTTPTVATLVTA